MAEPSPADGGAMQSQPEWCRVTLASIADAVITTDTAGRVTFLNPVAEALAGWTQAEAAGVPLEAVFQVVDQATRRTVESPAARALRDGVIVGLASHTLLVARDGTERPIDYSVAPIRSERNEVAGVVLVFRDVDGRLKTERALGKALAYADDIIATLREPFLVLDHDLRIRTANLAFYRSFRAAKEQTENRLLYELGDGEWDNARLRALLGEVLTLNDAVRDFEVEHDFPLLGRRTLLLNARRFPPDSETPELILLAIEDITARQRAEVAVQTSEVRYRRLFETARDGILILDAATGKIIDANPFMTELLGYPREEFLGKELWEIGLFGDRSANEAAFRELQERGYVRYEHLPLETEHGKTAEVEFVSNVYRVEGRLVAQCNIRDISERGRLERALKDQAEALADLHRRKDEFLAMLAHELRNPLAPIANAVHLLRLQRDEGPAQKQARTIIERQVTQLTRLVDDLLEVARIATGRVQLRPERVAMGGVVERAVEAARPGVEQRRHELTVSLPTGAVWVDADAARLEQVVVNLLNNAAKYTEEGGRIWVTLDQEGQECVVRVRDTGVGIAPELLPRVFDLFTQAERSLDRSQGGLGIGLALVQRLVELHHGRVEAHSSPGHGSEFVVRLPLAPPPDTRPSAGEAAPPATGPRLRVLVVDDNADAAASLAMVLRASGHEVRTAHDGPAALETALAYRPDAVVLDIGLPGLDGYEVARRLRQEASLRGVLLVAVTGYGQESDRRLSREAGFDHHLAKPADLAVLEKLLAAVRPRTA